jgi:hypothetical protein
LQKFILTASGHNGEAGSEQSIKIAVSKVPSESFIEYTTSMTNVATFAGGFTFGTLFAIPSTLDKYDHVTGLLSIAFILFATCLFMGIGIHWLLRKYTSEECLSESRLAICKAQAVVILLLLISGFAVLNFVLIAVGQKSVGYVGIGLLCLIPFWFLLVIYVLERHDDDPRYPTDPSREAVYLLRAKSRKILIGNGNTAKGGREGVETRSNVGLS